MTIQAKKGASLFLVIMLGSVILAVVLGLVSLLVRQQVIVRQLNESVLAFCGADSGIERILYAVRKESYDLTTCLSTPPTPCKTPYPLADPADPVLTNGVVYETYVQEIDSQTKLRSLGFYRQTRRAIEISY